MAQIYFNGFSFAYLLVLLPVDEKQAKSTLLF